MNRSDEFTDPPVKEAMKNKINAQIQKMRVAQAKGDKEAEQKIMILNERIRLIESCRPLNESRISNLQRLFKHYCQNRPKPQKAMSFDQILVYKQQLTMERFFALITDFKLNQIPGEDGSSKQLTDKSNIVLLFKKASANVRNLSFHEFVIALERLFILLFNETENYDKKEHKLKMDKKKRLEDYKKREMKKLLKRNKKLGIKQEPVKSEQPVQKQEESSSEEDEEEQVKETKNKTAKNPPPAKPESKQKQASSAPKGQVPPAPKSTQNDEMVKDMMKDFEIVNPNDEIKKAVKQVKKAKGKQQQQDDEPELQINFDPYQVSDEQKIESYMLRVKVDNYPAMEKKIRRFEKLSLRMDQVDEVEKKMDIKKSKMQFLKKDQLTHYQNGEIHEEWSSDKKAAEQFIKKRMKNIRNLVNQRSTQRNKSYLVNVMPPEAYQTKKKLLNDSFRKKQKDVMAPIGLARLTRLKQIEEENNSHFDLSMIYRSTPNQLPFHKINPQRYAAYDPTDKIFLQEYSFDSEQHMRRGSPRSQHHLVESTKKRVKEIEAKQSLKLKQMAQNKLKSPQHLEKFLQRKW